MKAIVIKDICPLYKEASRESELADEALYGMVVEILSKERGGFCYVRTHYNYEGFAARADLLEDAGCAEYWENAPKWTVWSPYLDVKAGPKVQAYGVACCPRGGLLEKLGGVGGERNGFVDDGYLKVGLPGGGAGFVRKSCVAPQAAAWDKSDETRIRAELVRTAMSYLGVQYRWGGKTPLGIDCSGLTSMAYMLHGILIYRDAEMRPEFEMREIPFEQKRPGDLLFFEGHVAMYIGNDEFIHSTAYKEAPGVVVNSLDPCSPSYRKGLMDIYIKTGSVFTI